MDEAAHGYTAFSLLETGKDEWGISWPINPRSVGDYKPPLYAYLTILPIKLFGLNEFAVRLPSALGGVFSVVLVYFLIIELFKSGLLAILSSLFLAISPWHISLTRGAFEMSLACFLVPLGLLFFFKGEKNKNFLILSSLVFGLSLFASHSLRYYVPFVLITLFLFKRKKFIGNLKDYLLPLAILLLLFFLNFYAVFTGGKTRVADIGIFSPTDKWQVVSDRQYEARILGMPSFAERIFNNKLVYVLCQFYKNYLGYFSFDFLFTKGPSEATYGMIPGRGVLYLFELPLLIVAIWQIFQKKDKKMFLILILLLWAPIPAAMAKGERAGGRAGTMLPFLPIISAYGGIELWRWTKKKFQDKSFYFLGFYCLLILLSLAFFLEDYFYHSPKYNAPAMAYGWKEAMEYIKENEDKYEHIVISRRFSEPQVAIAFYKPWDPADFQRQAKDWLKYEKMGFGFVDQLSQYELGKYVFRNFQFPEDLALTKTLFVGKDEDFWGRETGRILKTIYYPGPEKKIAIKIVGFK